MATVKLFVGTKLETSFDLEEGEVIIYGGTIDEKNHVTTINEPDTGCLLKLLKVVTLGIAGFFLPKNTKWKANIVVTNKRLISIPYSQTKRRAAQSWYYNTDITKVTAKDQKYTENALPMPQINFYSATLKMFTYLEFSRKLGSVNAKEWLKVGGMAAKKLGSMVGKSINEAADTVQQSDAQSAYNSAGSYTDRAAIQAQWSKDHAYNQKWAKIWEESGKLDLSQFDAASDPTYARRDYLASLINDCIEAAKG